MQRQRRGLVAIPLFLVAGYLPMLPMLPVREEPAEEMV